MEDRAIRGIPWAMLGYAGSKAITILATLVLARLLSPADFGVVALSFLTINVIGLFRDLGLGGALVLEPDLDERSRGTMLTMMVGMGLLMALVVAATAPLAADVFDEPRLTDLVRLLSLTLLFGGFNWFYETMLQRELEFRIRFLGSFSLSVVYAATAITLAALGAGVWSLAIGWVAGWVAQSVVLTAIAPVRTRPAFDRGYARKAVRSSRGFLTQGALAFVYQNVDYLAVARALGVGPLGLYTMSYRLSELPYWALADPVSQATFPGFARMHNRGEEVGPSFIATLQLLAVFICPLGVLLSATAVPFVAVFLGPSWAGMTGALAIFGLWGVIRPLSTTIGWLFNSLGRQSLAAVITAVGVGVLVPGVAFAASSGTIATVAWVMLAEAILALGLYAIAAVRRLGLAAPDLGRALAPPLLAAVPTWLSARGVVELLSGQADALALGAAVLAGAATYVVTIRLFAPKLSGTVIARVRQITGRGHGGGEGEPPTRGTIATPSEAPLPYEGG